MRTRASALGREASSQPLEGRGTGIGGGGGPNKKRKGKTTSLVSGFGDLFFLLDPPPQPSRPPGSDALGLGLRLNLVSLACGWNLVLDT